VSEAHIEHEGGLRRFNPYPSYTDSGVEWLGKVPAHWVVKRLKHLAALNPESLTEDTDPTLEIVYVDIGHVDSLGRIVEREQLTFAAAPTRARRLVRDGDVIVSTVRTYLRAIAPISEPDPRTVVSTGFAVVRPEDDLTSEYGAYVLRAPYFVERVVANSKGVSFPAINESEMASYELAIPPEPEQRAIAAFLESETARIDALVAKKERLIELLQEERTALISRAVAKGLDPNVPMKDSGVEWLGEIPAHWEVKRIKFIAQVGNGSTPNRDNPEYWGGEYPWLNSGVVNLHEVSEGADFVTALALAECHLPRIVPPAVLVGITGEGRTRGMATVLRIEATLNQHLAFIRPTSLHADVEYIRYVFHSAYQFLRDESGGGGSTKGALTCDQLGNMSIPFPPEAVQCAIAAFLDRETARIDALVAKVREAVERLEELRTALISAAVTGKIDVRGIYADASAGRGGAA
jgi:type I restriction enzyme, S subunit